MCAYARMRSTDVCDLMFFPGFFSDHKLLSIIVLEVYAQLINLSEKMIYFRFIHSKHLDLEGLKSKIQAKSIGEYKL